MTKKLLDVKGLTIAFDVGNKRLPAVENLNFHIDEGEVLGVVGESGCGKTVTFMGILGLLPEEGKVTGGSILFEGKDLANAKEQVMRQVRGNDISIIFQEPMTSLNPVYRVGPQISESLLLHTQLSQAEARKKALQMMELVGLPQPERLYSQYSHQLSGGMRQRVMIAMALVCNPMLLIADEPTTALDVTIQAQILDLLLKLNRETGTSIAFVSHDIGIIRQVCSRVLVMYAGHIIEVISAADLLEQMQHPYTVGLVNAIPMPDKKGETLYAIPGRVLNLSQRKEGCRFADRCQYTMEICHKKTPPMYDMGQNHLVRCYLAENRGGVVCEA